MQCEVCGAARPVPQVQPQTLILRLNCRMVPEPHMLCIDRECAAIARERQVFKELAVCE